MTNIIALITALGFFMFYTLTAILLVPLAIAVWVLRQLLDAIRWVQQRIV